MLDGAVGGAALVCGPDHGGLTGIAITERLRVADRVSAAFEREFVSLFALAKQRGRHFMVIKKALQHAGVEPVFNPKMIGATFYRREEVLRAECLNVD